MTEYKELADDAGHDAYRAGSLATLCEPAFQETSSAWLSVFGYDYYQPQQVIVRFVVWLARRACRFNKKHTKLRENLTP